MYYTIQQKDEEIDIKKKDFDIIMSVYQRILINQQTWVE